MIFQDIFQGTLSGLNVIALMEFFPYRTDAHKRVSKGYLVTAWLVIYAFDKMDLISNAGFNHAKSVHFT